MQVGNMGDINSMKLKDFYGLMKHLKRRNNIQKGEPVPLRSSQKEMIRITKEKEGV